MSWRAKAFAPSVPLVGGSVVCMSRAKLNLDSALPDGTTVLIEAAYDAELGRVVATKVVAKRSGPGQEITTRGIQQIHVQNALVKVVMNYMLFVIDESQESLPAAKVIDSFEPARGRSRVDQIKDAAMIYTVAKVANWPPLKTVAEKLSVSQSTATRLVSEARAAGLLDG